MSLQLRSGLACSLKVVGVFILLVIPQYSVSFATNSEEELTENQKIIHVLNRLGFGPRLGDIERVKAMGIEAYIEEQLHPASIPDPLADDMLADFTSLEMGLEEILAANLPVPMGRRSRATIFERKRLSEEAEREAAAVTDESGAARFRRMDAEAAVKKETGDEIRVARIIRAVYSERQLHEIMVDFWMNHFNVDFGGEDPFAAHFEQSVIRPGSIGSFENLLMAVAKHPSMLAYLDNWISSAPAEVIEQRLASLKPTLDATEYLQLLERMPFLQQLNGLNENYARALMELHTVGVDGGYTQEDVIEVAKVLTGWTVAPWEITNGREEEGLFVFDPLLHVEGDKTVLGQTIESGGIEEGEQVIRMLAHHPSTARYISTKLVRRFVADDPPAEVVEAASRTFEETGGDIREVLRTIFASPQFLSEVYYQVKIKKPLELVVSALRVVNAEVDRSVGGWGTGRRIIRRMGEDIYNHPAPDGNPDVAGAWINTNALLERLLFANDLANNKLLGVKVDLDTAEKLLTQLDLPRPTSEQIEQFRLLVRQVGSEQGQEMMGQEAMMAPSGEAAAGDEEEFDSRALVVATMLGSPQFQKR
ncbi:MAG: DUF1800 domain-containing protein [Acidobacteria bacterium]|nr:DUF1800 domain-containing protein [Acidobacteriota bacterium]